MTKFTLISTVGEGCQIAHDIGAKLFMLDGEYQNAWKEILDRVFDTSSDSTYLFDMSGNGKMADSLRESGKKVIGSSSFCDELEEDRKKGFKLMESCGFDVPEYREFNSFDDAIEFLKDQDDTFVFKASGKNIPCKYSYVPDDNSELIPYMNFLKEELKDEKDISIVLQRKIVGATVSTEGWFNGR